MLSVTLRLLSLVALGAAQTSTASIWVPPMDPKTEFPAQDVVASVAGSDGSTTTYVLDCASKMKDTISPNIPTAILSVVNAKATDPDRSCGGFPAPYTIVQGPSRIVWTYDSTDLSHPGKTPSVTPLSGTCVLSGTTEAVCTATDGTQRPTTSTFSEDERKPAPFIVAAGAVTATSPSTSAAPTEYTKNKANSTALHSGTDVVTYSTTRNPSARTQAMSGSSGSPVFRTGSITGISSVKASPSASAPPKSTNIGVQGSFSRRDGIFGALVIALVGAIL